VKGKRRRTFDFCNTIRETTRASIRDAFKTQSGSDEKGLAHRLAVVKQKQNTRQAAALVEKQKNMF
jgi:hypothetical protein